jgi:hypothetical protein
MMSNTGSSFGGLGRNRRAVARPPNRFRVLGMFHGDYSVGSPVACTVEAKVSAAPSGRDLGLPRIHGKDFVRSGVYFAGMAGKLWSYGICATSLLLPRRAVSR